MKRRDFFVRVPNNVGSDKHSRYFSSPGPVPLDDRDGFHRYIHQSCVRPITVFGLLRNWTMRFDLKSTLSIIIRHRYVDLSRGPNRILIPNINLARIALFYLFEVIRELPRACAELIKKLERQPRHCNIVVACGTIERVWGTAAIYMGSTSCLKQCNCRQIPLILLCAVSHSYNPMC